MRAAIRDDCLFGNQDWVLGGRAGQSDRRWIQARSDPSFVHPKGISICGLFAGQLGVRWRNPEGRVEDMEVSATTYKTGDIFLEDVEVLVNAVNCVGVMGRGIAFQFKRAFPENFRAYAAACRRNEVRPGEMFVFETGLLTNPKMVFNFPTKRHWRDQSRIEDIQSGLDGLVAEVRSRELRSIVIPALGCGLGGLDWSAVRARIQQATAEMVGVEVVVYRPGVRN